MQNVEERRKYQRAFFDLDDHVTGIFSLLNNAGKAISTYILNIGMGGIYFTLNSDADLAIKKGDRLVLLQIKASFDLEFLLNIDAEVKWVLNPPMLEHIGVGCEFVNIPESSLDKIKSFVDSWNLKS